MVAKLKAPVEIRGRDRGHIVGTGLLFRLQDVAALENTAGRPFPDWQNPDNPRRDLRFKLCRELHKAFLDAHILAESVPPPSEVCEAFDKVARAGREFLLSLGVELGRGDDPARLVAKRSIEIATSSGVLRALIERVEVETGRLHLPPKAGRGQKATHERAVETLPAELADNERIVEAVRCAGFVVAGAEGAIARVAKERRKTGPPKEVFGPALMEGLVTCYELMFAEAPWLARKDDNLSGNIVFDPYCPPLLWLRLALQQALSSLTGSRPDLAGPPWRAIIEADTVATGSEFAIPVALLLSAPRAVCKFTGSDDLAVHVTALASRNDQWLADLFHKAIRARRKSKATR
jgi:hypothetical protein